MAKNSILTDGEIALVWFLLQAHPTSETIYVDYDDV
jgi:ring-1,2-phenylacetyl-CoA epoxidase subunit PaaE